MKGEHNDSETLTEKGVSDTLRKYVVSADYFQSTTIKWLFQSNEEVKKLDHYCGLSSISDPWPRKLAKGPARKDKSKHCRRGKNAEAQPY